MKRGPCFSSQQIRSPHSHPPSLMGAQALSHYPRALITPKEGTRYPGTAPVPQSPLKILKLTSPKDRKSVV